MGLTYEVDRPNGATDASIATSAGRAAQCPPATGPVARAVRRHGDYFEERINRR